MSLAVMSGTGLYDLLINQDSREHLVDTPYGEATLYQVRLQNQELYFLPRHGLKHGIPPHLINYRANICALALVGVRDILAFCSVGGADTKLSPGSLILVEQFIDMTWGRESTFSEIGSLGHVEMTSPYCRTLSAALLKAAEEEDIRLLAGGVYLCTQGPRFETPAEIRAYAQWGANLIGMTGVPEAPLAREAGICYASVAVVANYAAGLVEKIDIEGITGATNEQQDNIFRLLTAFLKDYEAAPCSCREAKIDPCRKWPVANKIGG